MRKECFHGKKSWHDANHSPLSLMSLASLAAHGTLPGKIIPLSLLAAARRISVRCMVVRAVGSIKHASPVGGQKMNIPRQQRARDAYQSSPDAGNEGLDAYTEGCKVASPARTTRNSSVFNARSPAVARHRSCVMTSCGKRAVKRSWSAAAVLGRPLDAIFSPLLSETHV